MAIAVLTVSGGAADALEVIGQSKAVYRTFQDCVVGSRTAANGMRLLASRIGWTDMQVYEIGRDSDRSFLIQIDFRENGRNLSAIVACDDQGTARTKYLRQN